MSSPEEFSTDPTDMTAVRTGRRPTRPENFRRWRRRRPCSMPSPSVTATINAYCLVDAGAGAGAGQEVRGALDHRLPERAARRRADLDQGHLPHRRLADTPRFTGRRRGPAVGRRQSRGRAAARGRDGVPRQDHHPRDRVEGRHRQSRCAASPATRRDPTKTAGGSSGGSAAAVAAGMGACSGRHRRRRQRAHPGLVLRRSSGSNRPTAGSRCSRRARSARWRTPAR